MMSHTRIKLTGGPVSFAGAVSLEVSPAGVRPWRIPHADRDLFESPLQDRASTPAGVRLTLVSDTGSVVLEVEQPAAELATAGRYDLLVDGALHQRVHNQAGEPTVRFDHLPAGEHRLEIYLPQAVPVQVRSLAIDAGATARAWDDPRPRWVVYGSSITHCGAAAGPSETWPALVANRFGLNLTCLGYGGNCHLEPGVARMIRDLPADYISVCVGINVQGSGSLNARTFRPAVLGLIATIREKHPTTPLAVVSPICSPPRETTPNVVGMTLAGMRETVAAAVELLQQRGDEHLHYVDGLEVFGPAQAHHMPDALHPDAEGYRVLADRYSEAVMPKLLGAGHVAIS